MRWKKEREAEGMEFFEPVCPKSWKQTVIWL